MDKTLKRIAALALPTACIVFFCLIMILSEQVTLSISGFAVDSTGRLYVGENGQITVFHEGKAVSSISPRDSSYAFTIDSEDTIMLATPSRVYLMDTSGNILEETEDPSASMYSKLHWSGRTFSAANGDRYKKSEIFGWTRIIKNGSEVVYSISILSYIVRCLLILCFFSMFINGAWIIYHGKKAT